MEHLVDHGARPFELEVMKIVLQGEQKPFQRLAMLERMVRGTQVVFATISGK